MPSSFLYLKCPKQHKIGSFNSLHMLIQLSLFLKIVSNYATAQEPVSCQTNVCFHGGQCFIKRAPDGGREFECECKDGYGGDLCELKCTLPCQNGGKCLRSPTKEEWCECPAGFTGSPLCEGPAEEQSQEDCRQSPCPFAHFCLEDPISGSHHCEWDLCIRWGTPCSNNATCKPIKDDFICECQPGFRGRQCAEDVDECVEGTATIAATAAAGGPCQNGATCENTIGSYLCKCPPGFTGQFCEQSLRICEQQRPCGDRGECQDLEDGKSYQCRCHGNFTGKNCQLEQHPQECPSPFVSTQNEGLGTTECICPPGKAGDHCELAEANCDREEAEHCQNGGECIRMGQKAFCICPTGFIGAHCERVADGDGDNCTVNGRECLNGGRCVRQDGENGQRNICKCRGQFTGIWCDRPLRLTAGKSPATTPSESSTIGSSNANDEAKMSNGTINTDDPCTPNPCQNGGVCFQNGTTTQCYCPFGRAVGEFCQLKCHCPRGQGCAKSLLEPGNVECFRSEESLHHKNRTKSKNGQGEEEDDDEDEEEEERKNEEDKHSGKEGESSSTPSEEGIDKPEKEIPNNFDIFSMENGTLSDGEGGGGMLILENGKMQLTNGVKISNCSECVNALKCLENANRIKCLCSADYTGPLCDMKRPLCTTLDCSTKPGQRCFVQHDNPQRKEDFPQCTCPPGLGGTKCARITSLGFTNSSTLLLQSAGMGKKMADYKLSLTFRTTLQNVHLASGETFLGALEFSLWLRNGQLLLKSGINGSKENYFDSDLQMNDADWYRVDIWSNKDIGTGYEIWHSESGYLLARRTLSASHLFPFIRSTRLGHCGANAHFIGCMRDISLNGGHAIEADDEQAFGILPGCNREERCPTDGLAGHSSFCANNGKCIDLWDKFACECQRPFLPPKCEHQIREITFGHGDSPSNIIFGLNADQDQPLIAEKTKISFLLRTNRQQLNFPLFLLGESSGNKSKDEVETTGTFISGELQKGTVKVNVRLGGTSVFSLRSSVPVNDNKVHLVEIDREGNEVRLKVDQKAEPILRLARPFAHPLLANQLVIGTKPDDTSPSDALDNKGPNGPGNRVAFFKGTIQDFRINDHFVLLFDKQSGGEGEEQASTTEALPLFGQKLSAQNLLQGTVSDDVCALNNVDGSEDHQSPCGTHGQCRNIAFNDFECQCESGYMGPRCEQRDYCGQSSPLFSPTTSNSLCSNGTKCTNVEGGFVCLSTATLVLNSALRYALNPGNVIKSSEKHTNFTLEFRTRTQDGNLVKLQSPMESLVIQVRQGLLYMTSSSAFSNSSSTPLSHHSNFSIANGQWHKVVLRQQAAPNGLKIYLDENEEKSANGENERMEFFETNFSLKRFLLDPGARISIGRVPDQQGFKGCLQNVQLGKFPPLSFIGLQQDFPNNQTTNSFTSAPHFALQRRENVPSLNGCQSLDVCAKNPCLNGGRCEDQFNQMKCQCPQGLEGEFCELPTDECDSMNGHKECGQHSRCVDELVGFRCQCAPGYSGPKCMQEDDLCNLDICKNGGKCHTINGTATCECSVGKFIGQWCQMEASVKCSEAPCQNGAICFQSAHGEIGCSCRPGFTGPLCELRVDPCREMPCMNGGKCISTTATFSNSSSSIGNFNCECMREFGGTLCEKLADNCGRLGTRACSQNGRCENVFGGHRCLCYDGWSGRDCSIRLDICQEEMPCWSGGTCLSDESNPNAFRCQCPPFYLGERCEIAGICAENPCMNGGECVQTSASEHVCRCPRGFQGQTCEQRIDFCDTDPCLNGATCVPLVGDFKCQCIPGFMGKRCEEDINECATPRINQEGPPCFHEGQCLDRVNGFECNCQGTGYKGSRCELDIDECTEAALNCQNGECINLNGTYRCECKSGYIGQRCHITDPCVPNPLTNRTVHNCMHGECVRPRVVMGAEGREFATHDCDCLPGFTGELCMRLVEAQHAMTLSNFIGLGIVVLVLCISLLALLYLFVACTRRKRANQGTYSPSNQEMTGQARFTGISHQNPPAIIHPNNHHHQIYHHKPRRKH